MSAPTTKGKRLPNELLAEIANALPAGVSSLAFESDFLKRMKPLSAFIRPRLKKFKSKRSNALHRLGIQRELRMLNWDKWIQTYRLLSSDLEAHLQMPFDQAKSNEFARRQAALKQQENELTERSEELLKEYESFKSAWTRSKQLARELAASGANKNGHSSSGADTVCEASSSKKRKNPTRNGEAGKELAAEEMMKKQPKKAKTN